MKLDLPQNIKFTLDTLISNGHKAYIVGGCVRDLLCGRLPCDYDITTSALPHEVQLLFDKTIATGIKHGTVTVVINGEQIEITTFRTENTYTDSRHPSIVSFVTDVKEDLSRRDFTVNAMCYNDREGLIDCFDGKKDIENRTLKAVGDAKTRFCEDALRILRLFRFASTLGFNIEKQTFDAALECSPLLKNISAERVFAELKKTAFGNNISSLTPLLKCGGLEPYCLSQGEIAKISTLKHKEDLRTFALLNLTSSDISKTLSSLKCSNKFKDYCEKMCFLTKNIIRQDKVYLKKALNFAGENTVRDVLEYYRDILDIDISKYETLLNEVISFKEPYLLSHLKISGKDIIALGIDDIKIGDILHHLLNEVIADPSLNNREKLLELVSN